MGSGALIVTMGKIVFQYWNHLLKVKFYWECPYGLVGSIHTIDSALLHYTEHHMIEAT